MRLKIKEQEELVLDFDCQLKSVCETVKQEVVSERSDWGWKENKRNKNKEFRDERILEGLV